MKLATRIAKQRTRRGFRVRNQVRSTGRLRLTVFRSNLHMYAQIIDDATGQTLVAAATTEKELGGAGSYQGNKDAAARVGAALGQRAKEKGIEKVAFDRGRYKYHGRVAALADAAREAGLDF
jgi:large subunit ribosomal protein L18